MPSTTGHKEVPAKVNAWVDSGVAPLVEALSLFKNVVTLDSCEGTESEGAYVYFKCWGSSKRPCAHETCEFMIWLSSVLRSQPNPCSDYRLRLEWMASDEPMANITTYRNNVSAIAAKLSLLAADVTHQTSWFECDKVDTMPRNSTTCQDHQL